jgi:hypothetical protein
MEMAKGYGNSRVAEAQAEALVPDELIDDRALREAGDDAFGLADFVNGSPPSV